MFGKKKVKSSKSMTKEELAGEIYDLNKEQGYKNPYSRSKAIKIMVNGMGTAKGYSKVELEELRDSLLNKKLKETEKSAVAPKPAARPTINPKIAKADELRKIANSADAKVQKIVKARQKKLALETDKEKRKQIDKQCREQYDEAMKKRAEAITAYESYLEDNYTLLERLTATGKDYTISRYSKTFLNNLQKTKK